MDISRLVKHKLNIAQFRVPPISSKSISYTPTTKRFTITGVKEGSGFTYTDTNGEENIIPFKCITDMFFNSKNASQYIGKKITAFFTYKMVKGKMTCVKISATFRDFSQIKSDIERDI